jgi:hypothetical protein
VRSTPSEASTRMHPVRTPGRARRAQPRGGGAARTREVCDSCARAALGFWAVSRATGSRDSSLGRGQNRRVGRTLPAGPFDADRLRLIG